MIKETIDNMASMSDAALTRSGVNRFDEYDSRLKENQYSVEGFYN
ncbi:hypothetical protein [Halonatronomonas betaini]|nr:hypothetical protein [Halonatronomonas betaini]